MMDIHRNLNLESGIRNEFGKRLTVTNNYKKHYKKIMTKKHLKSIFVGGAIILILASSGLVIYLLYLIKTNSNPAYLPQIIREKIADFNPENYDDLLIKIGVTGTGNGAYQDGDIVMIRPSTHKWSKREQTEFLIVRVPKLTDKQKRELVKPMKKNEEIVKRRIYGVDYTNILNQKKIVLIRQKRKEFRRKPLIDLSQIIKKAPSQISVIPENKRLVKAKLDPPKYIVYLDKIKNYFFSSVKAATQAIHTIKEDGSGDYTTLASWEAAQQRDLVAADEIEIAQIDGTWTSPDTTAVTIDGWTTDADHYIRIYTTETARHNGKWDESKYRLEGENVDLLKIRESYVRIEGLQFYLTATTNTWDVFYQSVDLGSSDVRISSNIFKGNQSDSGAGRALHLRATGTYKVWNNVFYNFSLGGSIYVRLGASAYCYNNTVTNNNYGIRVNSDAGTVIAKNNITQDCTDGFDGNFHSDSDYNISDISDDAPGSNSKTCTVSFIDEVNDNFHLAPNDTCAKDAGTDLSSDPNLAFTDDIDGETRPGGAAWDIGADEEIPVEFVSTIMESGGDYDSLSSWEDAIECDLTSTSTRVYSFSDHSGTIPDGTTVSTDSGASTATLLHQSNLNNQVLLVNIQGSFDAGDVVTDGTNTVTLSDNGAPAIAVAKIDGTWTSPDTTPVTIDGWTTDADHYIRIYTTETARHNGKWDESKYRLEIAGDAIKIKEGNVRIEGLQVEVEDPGSEAIAFFYNYVPAGEQRLSYCIAKYVDPNNYDSSCKAVRFYGTGTPDPDITFKVWNNIFYDFPSYTFYIQDYKTTNTTVYLYNNTIYNYHNNAYRIDGGTCIAKNNIAQNHTGPYPDAFYGTFDGASDYNISDISDDAPGSNSKTCTVSFIDEANDDFHLASNDTCAKDSGVDLFTDSNLSFSDDIDGESRSGTWDIGADEAPETPVEFVSTIMESGGDYDSLSSWESAINCDLTSTSTRVYSFSDHSGTIPDGTTVSTDSGASTATLLHQSNLNNQVLLVNIQGSFDAGDVVTDGTNTVTLSDNGAPAIAVAKIDGTWTSPDTTPVVIDGWTTDADHYIRIYTTETARHNGKWDESAYRLYNTGWLTIFRILEDYVRVEGLQIDAAGENTNGLSVGSLSGESSSEVRISHNILRQSYTGNNRNGIGCGSYSTTKIWNNIVYGFGYAGIRQPGWDNYATYIVYNNTVVDCGTNFSIGGNTNNTTLYLKNNLAQGGTTDYSVISTATTSNNLSEDNTSPNTEHRNKTVSFADEANDDFHLASNDTCAKDSGVDLFTDSNLSFSDDIDGESRSGTWDIGADEAPETPVEFVSTIMESGGDYDSLSSWESAINCDLTSTSTRVYSFSDHSGTIPDGTTVSTDSGASTATLLHQSNLNNQVLLVNIQGSFDAGDVVTDGTNTVTLSDNGAPAIAVAKIDGTWTSPDTTPVVIDGWTTDADHYIRIYTTETARHNGKWDESAYRLEAYNGYGGVIEIGEPNIRIEGLQIRNTRDTSGSPAAIKFTVGEAGEAYIFNNIMRCNWHGFSNNNSGILQEYAADNQKFYIKNNLIYDMNGIYIDSLNNTYHSWQAYIYNNTIISDEYFCFNLQRSNGTVKLKNNLAQGNSPYQNYYFEYWDQANAEYVDNLSEDNTSPNTEHRNKTVSFIDEANDDFRLAVSDTAARDAGTNLSGDSNLSFTDDIDGETRPGGAAWDIGADELKKAAQINTPITNKFTSGLVGNWTFNGPDIDWSTNTAYDRSGQGNNGTIYGAKPAIGKVGQALEFDGINDYVDCGNIAIHNQPAYSIEMWVLGPSGQSDKRIFAEGSTSDYDPLFTMGTFGGKQLAIYIRDDDGTVALGHKQTTKDVFDGTWHHIAWVDDSGSYKIYIDGVEDASGNYTKNTKTLDRDTIGAVGRSSYCCYFNGLIDEVRIYNRALSAEEIAEHYRAGARKFKIDPTKSGKTIIK